MAWPLWGAVRRSLRMLTPRPVIPSSVCSPEHGTRALRDSHTDARESPLHTHWWNGTHNPDRQPDRQTESGMCHQGKTEVIRP